MKAFSSPKNSSIGFRSGEYGGKNTSLTPKASKRDCILSEWWKLALSITTTDRSAGKRLHRGRRASATQNPKPPPPVEPSYTEATRTPSIVYAGSILSLLSPRLYGVRRTGAIPEGAQPDFRTPVFESAPDSSTNTSWLAVYCDIIAKYMSRSWALRSRATCWHFFV